MVCYKLLHNDTQKLTRLHPLCKLGKSFPMLTHSLNLMALWTFMFCCCILLSIGNKQLMLMQDLVLFAKTENKNFTFTWSCHIHVVCNTGLVFYDTEIKTANKMHTLYVLFIKDYKNPFITQQYFSCALYMVS
jgi:hypothetical protein